MTRSPGSLTSSSASSVCSSCEEEPVAPRSPPEPAPAADWAADKNVPVQAGGDLLAALVEHRPEAPLHLVGVHQPEFFHDVRLQPTVEGELVWLNYVSSLAEGFLLAQLNGSIFTHLSVAENSKRPVFNNWLIQTSIFPGMALGSIFDPLTRRVLDARTSVIMCIGGLCLCCVSTVISLDPIAIAWERFIAGLLLGKTCALIVLFTARSTAFVDSTKFCLARNIGLVGGGFMAALVSLVFLFHVDEYESTAAAGVTVMKSRVSAITPPVLDRVWVRCTALVPMSLLVLALWIFLRRLRYLSPSEYVARKDFANAKAMILNLYDLGSQASQATQEMTPGTVGTKADALVEIVAAQNFSASRVVGRGVWRSTVRGFTMEATGHKALIASSAYLLAKAGISFKWSLLITFIAMLLGCVMALLNTMVLLRFVDRKVLLLAGALTQTSVAASLAVLTWDPARGPTVRREVMVLFVTLFTLSHLGISGVGTGPMQVQPRRRPAMRQGTPRTLPHVVLCVSWLLANVWVTMFHLCDHEGAVFTAISVCGGVLVIVIALYV